MSYVFMGVVKRRKRKDLPRDVDALIALIEQRDERIARLEHNLSVYARMLFGQSSEKRTLTGLASGHPHQMHLFAADLLADAERIASETGACGNIEVDFPEKAKRPTKRGRRKEFPEHLPVVTSTFEIPKDDQVCSCGGELHQIGFEETQELERIEITIVHKKKRAKYGCRSCGDGVVTAPGPARVIDKGLLGPGFLAHVISERFQFHMPYYRLEQKYAGEGLDLSRSVLERSVARCAELLEPLHKALGEEVMAQDLVFTDDTKVRMARAGESGKSKEGRLWIYADKEGRHFYDFTESRSREGPDSILADFRGYLQADAYSVYDKIFEAADIIEVACWAHTRRKFEKAHDSDPDLSNEALELIGELYAIEKVAKKQKLAPEGVAELRQKYALPALEKIHAWLGVAETKVLPKSPMGEAIHYAFAQWEALKVYTTDGRLEIDNNRAERAMKPVAVGRKNWLFVLNEGGGKTAAIMMSLIRTAIGAGINVPIYLRDVLQRIATESDVKKLLPHGWKQHFEAEVMGRRKEIIDFLIADQRGE